MTYALSTTATPGTLPGPVTPPAVATPPPSAPAKPLTRELSVRAEVLIPESAERFADLVVSTHRFRKEMGTLLVPAKPNRLAVLGTGAAHCVPGLVSIASLVAGIGEGVAAGLALWGVVRCVLPARASGNPVSDKTAMAVRDAYLNAASGRDDTGVAALRHAAIAALEEARRTQGLSPQAELTTQTLRFTPTANAAADEEGRRAAEAAEALLPRQYGDVYSVRRLDVHPYETLALEAQAKSFKEGNDQARYTLDVAAANARKAVEKAAAAHLKRLAANASVREGKDE